MVVQTPAIEPLRTTPGGYGGVGSAGVRFGGEPCGAPIGIVTTRLKLGDGSVLLPEAVLPVDLATNGRELAVVAAGNTFNDGLAQVFVVNATAVRGTNGGCVATVRGNVPGQAVAVAFDANDALLVQTREPASLHIMSGDRHHVSKTISLATDSVADTGHAIFHSNSGGFVACASCHAEGADDGHVWTFDGVGPRRTPSLLGTVANTEPFHWDGDQKDLRDLVDHIFVERMSGPKVGDEQLVALRGWLFAQPAPVKLHAQNDVAGTGAALFQERCTSCHAGPMLTNNETVDVGTGGVFQVPSLVGVGWRQSLMHSGCGRKLADRFDASCGGTLHGKTKDLSAEQIANLVDFLETL
jgi:cytochrome c peroxidase